MRLHIIHQNQLKSVNISYAFITHSQNKKVFLFQPKNKPQITRIKKQKSITENKMKNKVNTFITHCVNSILPIKKEKKQNRKENEKRA